MSLDPYAILELQHGASERDIKRAFRRLSLLHHPDRHQGSHQSEERLKLITAAYHRLKDSGWTLPQHVERSKQTKQAPPVEVQEESLPQFWPDGAPIHYPTREEIEALLRDVTGERFKRLVRAHEHSLWVARTFARLYLLLLAAMVVSILASIAYRLAVDFLR